MPAAKISSTGVVTQLDRKAQPQDVILAKDVADPEDLAQILKGTLGDVKDLQNRHDPRRIYFYDQTTGTSGAALTLPHKFGARVHWQVIDWSSSGTSLWNLKKDTTNTTQDTLVLLSYVAGTATIKIEEAG